MRSYIKFAPDGTPTGHETVAVAKEGFNTAEASALNGKPYLVPADLVDPPVSDSDTQVKTGPAYESDPARIVFTVSDKPLAACKAAYQVRLAGEFTRRTAHLVGSYSPLERETWDTQLREAQAVDADPNAVAPLLEEIAIGQETKAQVAAKVLAKAAALQNAVAPYIKRRRALADAIESATSAADVRAIDIAAGWPE